MNIRSFGPQTTKDELIDLIAKKERDKHMKYRRTERSFRRAVVEKEIISANPAIAPKRSVPILKKAIFHKNRHNPDRNPIIREGRRLRQLEGEPTENNLDVASVKSDASSSGQVADQDSSGKPTMGLSHQPTKYSTAVEYESYFRKCVQAVFGRKESQSEKTEEEAAKAKTMERADEGNGEAKDTKKRTRDDFSGAGMGGDDMPARKKTRHIKPVKAIHGGHPKHGRGKMSAISLATIQRQATGSVTGPSTSQALNHSFGNLAVQRPPMAMPAAASPSTNIPSHASVAATSSGHVASEKPEDPAESIRKFFAGLTPDAMKIWGHMVEMHKIKKQLDKMGVVKRADEGNGEARAVHGSYGVNASSTHPRSPGNPADALHARMATSSSGEGSAIVGSSGLSTEEKEGIQRKD
ncbi:hypothetical protein BC835DRAFT_1380836 [Cytidiella melzeri]|nr:hypothetical protein BC835DRAFT_1380836 [Cytidiella melzeri]